VKRLSYHGWAAILLVLEALLVFGGLALIIIPTSIVSTLPGGEAVTVLCGSPGAPNVPESAACAASFGARETMGLLSIGAGVVLFGGQLLVGMAIAGLRDALANAPQQPSPVTTGGDAG